MKNNIFNVTPGGSNVSIRTNFSYYITKTIIALSLRIYLESPVSNNILVNFPITIRNSGYVFPIFAATSEWTKSPNKIVYGYIGVSSITTITTAQDGPWLSVNHILKTA